MSVVEQEQDIGLSREQRPVSRKYAGTLEEVDTGTHHRSFEQFTQENEFEPDRDLTADGRLLRTSCVSNVVSSSELEDQLTVLPSKRLSSSCSILQSRFSRIDSSSEMSV